MFKKRSNNIGAAAEQQATRWLKQQGLQLITSNYRGARGEVDIVMLEDDYLVFVEVRYRKQTHFGSPTESIGWRKQQHIIRAAKHFLLTHKRYQHYACRFDVVALQGDGAIEQWRFDWIKNAF